MRSGWGNTLFWSLFYILIYSYGVSFIQLINTDFVAVELIRAIAGSVGIISTVPCVAAIGAYLYGHKNSK